AIDLAGAGQQVAGLLELGQAERVVRAQRADLQGGNGVAQVIDRTGRRGEVEHVVHCSVDLQRVGNVVLLEREVRVIAQVFQVGRRARDQVIDANDLVPLRQEPVAQVREIGRA